MSTSLTTSLCVETIVIMNIQKLALVMTRRMKGLGVTASSLAKAYVRDASISISVFEASTTEAFRSDESYGDENEREASDSKEASQGKVNLLSYKATKKRFRALSYIWYKFQFIASVEISIASDSDCATFSQKVVVCFYELHFKFKLRLPFPHFIRAFQSYFNLTPTTLMLNCWRTILAIQTLENIYGFRVEPCVLLKWYHMKENTHEHLRYVLNARGPKKLSLRLLLVIKIGMKDISLSQLIGENLLMRTQYP